jgi:hypothetical protein
MLQVRAASYAPAEFENIRDWQLENMEERQLSFLARTE